MDISKSWTDTKLNITWITLTGTNRELEKAKRWIDANRTSWVMEGKMLDASMELSLSTRWILLHQNGGADAPCCQRLGFRDSSDLMRFKLSH